jgi:hypothetical protein
MPLASRYTFTSRRKRRSTCFGERSGAGSKARRSCATPARTRSYRRPAAHLLEPDRRTRRLPDADRARRLRGLPPRTRARTGARHLRGGSGRPARAARRQARHHGRRAAASCLRTAATASRPMHITTPIQTASVNSTLRPDTGQLLLWTRKRRTHGAQSDVRLRQRCRSAPAGRRSPG